MASDKVAGVTDDLGCAVPAPGNLDRTGDKSPDRFMHHDPVCHADCLGKT